jgi:hypothetical protein
MYGPLRTISMDDARYFKLLVDDFCRKMCMYFLKKKSKVFLSSNSLRKLYKNKSV